MAKRPIVLIHGYSDKGASFWRWAKELALFGYDVKEINTCTYRSLTNEVTIKDVAEGFDRALRTCAGLHGGEEFDAVVHSTGMLVLRSWLTTYAHRADRVKHIIGLAPASFGSPLACRGRSWMGAMFKGNKEFGPDFMEAGDRILDALELGSSFTWDLAHKDQLQRQCYGPNWETPYVFVFCGTKGYGGLKKLIAEPGTDGTVRLAGCALNTQKFTIDLSRDPARDKDAQRVIHSGWTDVEFSLWPIEGLNHGTILSEPTELLLSLVGEALQVENKEDYQAWKARAEAATQKTRDALPQWQQFVIRTVDERGDPVTDYYLELCCRNEIGVWQAVEEFDLDVRTYSGDKSFRCLQVDLRKLREYANRDLSVRIVASSGSLLVGYHGIGSERLPDPQRAGNPDAIWDAVIELPKLVDGDVSFFYPFTTTLVEIRLNRDPMPFAADKNKVCWFGDEEEWHLFR